MNRDSKLSAGAAALLFWYGAPPSRAAVPQGEFYKSLSVYFNRPIHPTSRLTRDHTSGLGVSGPSPVTSSSNKTVTPGPSNGLCELTVYLDSEMLWPMRMSVISSIIGGMSIN